MSFPDQDIDASYPRLTERRLQRLQRHLKNEQESLKSDKNYENDSSDSTFLNIKRYQTLCDLRLEELFTHGDKYVNQEEEQETEENIKKILNYEVIDDNEPNDYSDILDDLIRSRSTNISPLKENNKSITLNTTTRCIPPVLNDKSNEYSVSVLKIDNSELMKATVNIHNGGGTISRIFDPNDTALLLENKEKFIGIRPELLFLSNNKKSLKRNNNDEKKKDQPKIYNSKTSYHERLSNRTDKLGKKEQKLLKKMNFNLKFPNLENI